jgi:hypothetical protein
VSDRFCVTLRIGGPIRRGVTSALCGALEECNHEFGDFAVAEGDLDKATEKLLAESDQQGWLELQDPESCGDEFTDVMLFCFDENIAYDYFWDAESGIALRPGGRSWRPGMDKPVEYPTDGYVGERTVERAKVRPVLDRLREARYKAYQLDTVIKELEQGLGPDIPDLAPLTILEATDGHRGTADG